MLLTVLLTACSDQSVYEYSVDVDSSEWTPTDTLFYPIHVRDLASPYAPVERNYPYCVSLAVRSGATYPAPVIPLHFKLDREYRVFLDLGDDNSVLNGDTWGSFYTKQFDLTHAIVSFSDSGDYVLKVWPEDTIKSVSSITVILE